MVSQRATEGNSGKATLSSSLIPARDYVAGTLFTDFNQPEVTGYLKFLMWDKLYQGWSSFKAEVSSNGKRGYSDYQDAVSSSRRAPNLMVSKRLSTKANATPKQPTKGKIHRPASQPPNPATTAAIAGGPSKMPTFIH